MDNKARVKILRQIVDLEKQFMTIDLPASGSLYYRRDLQKSQFTILLHGQADISIADQIVIGPTAQHEWWYQERALLDIDRGPWNSFTSCFEAPAKREIEFCKRFGKPRLHVERYLRELHQFKEMSPTVHTQLLSDYLRIAPFLEIPPEHPFSRPTLRHPDFSPNNILMNPSNEIVGIIDWQHAVVQPLCLCAGILNHFQNWGDPLSETLAKPDVKLPANFDELDENEQSMIQETMRKRLVHFYYAALTMRVMPDHFDALRNENSMLRAKLFSRAGAPWEGDSVSLKYTTIQVYKNWPMGVDGLAPIASVDCPVKYSEEEIQQSTKGHDQDEAKMQGLTEMKEIIGIDALGWVPDDEQLEKSKAIMQTIKEGLMEHSETEIERTAVKHHFPFDDHDESS